MSTGKRLSRTETMALAGDLLVKNEEIEPIKPGKKKKLKESEVEAVRQEAVINTLQHIIDNPGKVKNAKQLLEKTALLITPEETRRLALLKSKEVLSYRNGKDKLATKGFEGDNNPSANALALYEAGMYLRTHSPKQLCYFTCEEIEPIISDYFNLCATARLPLSVPGLATYLGVSVKQLLALAEGANGNEFYDLLQYAINTILAFKSEMAEDGNIAPSTYVFNAKNFFGMKDVAEKQVVVTRFGDSSKQRQIIDALPDSD